jgi:hypothetical protein
MLHRTPTGVLLERSTRRDTLLLSPTCYTSAPRGYGYQNEELPNQLTHAADRANMPIHGARAHTPRSVKTHTSSIAAALHRRYSATLTPSIPAPIGALILHCSDDSPARVRVSSGQLDIHIRTKYSLAHRSAHRWDAFPAPRHTRVAS